MHPWRTRSRSRWYAMKDEEEVDLKPWRFRGAPAAIVSNKPDETGKGGRMSAGVSEWP